MFDENVALKSKAAAAPTSAARPARGSQAARRPAGRWWPPACWSPAAVGGVGQRVGEQLPRQAAPAGLGPHGDTRLGVGPPSMWRAADGLVIARRTYTWRPSPVRPPRARRSDRRSRRPVVDRPQSSSEPAEVQPSSGGARSRTRRASGPWPRAGRRARGRVLPAGRPPRLVVMDPNRPLGADLVVGGGQLVVGVAQRVWVLVGHGVQHRALGRHGDHRGEHAVALEARARPPRRLPRACRSVSAPTGPRRACQRTLAPAPRSSSSARSESPGSTSMPRTAARSSVTRKPSRRASRAVARTQ